MNKKLTLAVVATAVAGLMALIGAPLFAQSGAASQSTIQGVWRVTEVTTTGPNASTNKSPQPITTVAAFGFQNDPTLDPNTPFVVCEDQKYALCAEASCFVYDGVAYCKCNVLKGDSISLQDDFSSPIGERNVCSVNQQGKTNGYMVSTFSFPTNVEKGAAPLSTPAPEQTTRGQASRHPSPTASVMAASASRAPRAKGSPASIAASRRMRSSVPVQSQQVGQAARMLSDTRYLAPIIQGQSRERGVTPARARRVVCRILRRMEAPFLSGRQPVCALISRRSWMGRFRNSTSACVNVPRRMATPPVRRQTDHDPAMMVTMRIRGEEMSKMGDVITRYTAWSAWKKTAVERIRVGSLLLLFLGSARHGVSVSDLR